MCGIVGMAGDISLGHRDSFHDMLMWGQVRGKDSTGAIRVAGNNDAHIAKAVGPPEYLLGTKKYDIQINAVGKVFIGHNRHKTFGAANYENAHPFHHGSLIGVHNGTLRNIYGLEGVRDFGTDSEWLYWMASKEGMENVIPEIDFCGCLVWWDSSDNTLNFFRNEERPLWVTYSEDCKVMVWASEIPLTGAFSRNYKLWDGGEQKRVFVPLEPNKIFSYRVTSLGRTAKDIFTLTSIKEVKAKEVRSYSGNVNARHGSGGVGTTGTNGGQVVRPFEGRGRTFLHKMFGDHEDLNDSLPFEKENQALPLLLPALTQAQEGSQNTTTSEDESSNSSTPGTGTGQGETSLKSGKRQTLSLASENSKTSARGSNVATVIDFASCSLGFNPEPVMVSHRVVAGIHHISCKKTSREWSELTFDTETGGICHYCKEPIGELKEVHEIFVRKYRSAVSKETAEEIYFVCTGCCTPNLCVA